MSSGKIAGIAIGTLAIGIAIGFFIPTDSGIDIWICGWILHNWRFSIRNYFNLDESILPENISYSN